MEALSKTALRQRIRTMLGAMTAEDCRTLSTDLCGLLRLQPIWSNATSILCFAPLVDEPDIMPLLKNARIEGKVVALPCFNSQTGCYSARVVSCRSKLIPGRFGVLEPGAGCPPVPLNQLDLVLVPGIAFDLGGRRLGRGKGFYDRLLAEVRGHKCGVAFDTQIVAEVPVEPHDIRVYSILTPTRWHLCPRAA
jgi:5-formyltetrahydrofolate cyclo-ligase